MLRGFFDKPYGNGSGLNIYMFGPRRWAHAVYLILSNPSYLVARIKVILDQLIHPSDPWLTRASIEFLEAYLHRGMSGFEYGSGRSTQWFARRVAHLVSVEDDPVWYDRVKASLTAFNVDYRFVDTGSGSADYVDQLLSFRDATFDFIVIDGSFRDPCIAAAADKVRPGGVVILDNADERRDVRPLHGFTRHSTDNGVWQTDLFVRPAPSPPVGHRPSGCETVLYPSGEPAACNTIFGAG